MKTPYKLHAVVALPARYEYMRVNTARILPRLEPRAIDEDAVASVACYGPSLRETYRKLTRPIISMSGATKWLAEQGVTPDYHVDMDPRASKVGDVQPVIPGVKYLMASVCHPSVFDYLLANDADVMLWHVVSANMNDDLAWLARHDPGQLLIQGNSTIGLTALQIGGLLGFRRFEIHGMDSSFTDDGARHAGPHSDPKAQRNDTTWAACGKVYRTSQIMANAAAESVNVAQLYPILAVFHGDGLTQALIKEARLPNACCADEPERVAAVRGARITIIPTPPADRASAPSWSPWEAICFGHPDPRWLEELQIQFAIADARRPLARFNTGSISIETGMLLRAVCEWKQPSVAIEVGTFIGKSTLSLRAGTIYTCDRDNDCLPSTPQIVTHPYTTSTAMLSRLVARGVKADLFFLDGRLTDEDVALIEQLAAPGAVFLFDDFHPGPTGKGLANCRKLTEKLSTQYAFLEPYKLFSDRSTLAMMMHTT